MVEGNKDNYFVVHTLKTFENFILKFDKLEKRYGRTFVDSIVVGWQNDMTYASISKTVKMMIPLLHNYQKIEKLAIESEDIFSKLLLTIRLMMTTVDRILDEKNLNL